MIMIENKFELSVEEAVSFRVLLDVLSLLLVDKDLELCT